MSAKEHEEAPRVSKPFIDINSLTQYGTNSCWLFFKGDNGLVKIGGVIGEDNIVGALCPRSQIGRVDVGKIYIDHAGVAPVDDGGNFDTFGRCVADIFD